MDTPTRTKVVTLCGAAYLLRLLDCWKCGEPTWFREGAQVCDSCASEFIDIRPEHGHSEPSTVRRCDIDYEGDIADRVEEAGQPEVIDGEVKLSDLITEQEEDRRRDHRIGKMKDAQRRQGRNLPHKRGRGDDR